MQRHPALRSFSNEHLRGLELLAEHAKRLPRMPRPRLAFGRQFENFPN